MTDETVLRVVIFREGDFWLAQGLEHDVGVQAEHLRDLMARWELMLDDEIKAGSLTALPPALFYFEALWPHRAGEFIPEPPTSASPGGVRCAFAMVA